MADSKDNAPVTKCAFETALDLTGFGKYNVAMLISCCLLVLTMYTEMFGVSVIVPVIACDMSLSVTQQGILSAVPLLGVILSSYMWGLAADTIGRRKTLMIAMPIGFVMAIAASMAPTFATIATLKFLSVTFTSAANAGAFVLMGESVPSKHRNRVMFIMACFPTFSMCAVAACATPLLKFAFHIEIPWLYMEYRPWRLVLQVVSLTGPIGALILLFLKESPKFLLSKKKDEEAAMVLRTIFQANAGKSKTFPVSSVYLDDTSVVASENTSILKKIWNQTAPLFKPPLLKNNSIIYYLLLCSYMTSTGIAVWVPTMANTFFTGDISGKTFCEVASRSTSQNVTSSADCDNILKPLALYAVMAYSAVGTLLTIVLSFGVGPLGKKKLTLLVFVVSSLCGLLVLFVRVPLLSIALLYMFLYVAQIMGNINAYLIDLNPTHLRGMASCLSVVVARGFGFFSVQLIGRLLENYCTPMMAGFVMLVLSGLVVATFLPPDRKPKKEDIEENTTSDKPTVNNDTNKQS